MNVRLGPMTDCQERLKRDYIEFSRCWAAVREDWLDDRCRQFETEHLSSLGPSLNRFVTALNEFSDAVRKAEAMLRDEHQPSEGLE